MERDFDELAEELLVILFIDPRRAEPHCNVACADALGLHGLQRFYIAFEAWIFRAFFACFCKFRDDVARKIFARGHKPGIFVPFRYLCGITENSAFKLGENGIIVLARKLFDVCNVYSAALVLRDLHCLVAVFGLCRDNVRTYRAL